VQEIFGRGIVKSSADFGMQGDFAFSSGIARLEWPLILWKMDGILKGDCQNGESTITCLISL